MPSVLLTAFEPYGPWKSNASWLALVELTREMPQSPQLTTRRYPVDFDELTRRLADDLQANYDYVIHLGQAPGSARLQLEAIGLNVAVDGSSSNAMASLAPVSGPGSANERNAPGFDAGANKVSAAQTNWVARPLQADGPVAYRTALPLDEYAVQLRDAGIPAQVSFHAGTYLCNAAMYLTHFYCERMALNTQAAFIHVPLDTSQVIDEPRDTPSLPTTIAAAGLRLILANLAEQ